ncbi:MAG: hypothetical protein HYY13_13475 [Nitrospirae bacterium]|nr:hypothetical protein [Nitrospirota bacterium]
MKAFRFALMVGAGLLWVGFRQASVGETRDVAIKTKMGEAVVIVLEGASVGGVLATSGNEIRAELKDGGKHVLLTNRLHIKGRAVLQSVDGKVVILKIEPVWTDPDDVVIIRP